MGEDAFIAGGVYDFRSGEVDALIEGHLDLALFRQRVPGAREMRGPVEARLSLQGPAARMEILGEARLIDGELFLQPMPEKITSLTGTVILEEGRVELRDLAGRMGGGDLRLNGEVDWGSDPVSVDLALEGNQVLLVIEGTAKALVDTELALTGDFDDLALSGRIDFLKARYFREFKDKAAREKLKSLAAAGKEEPGEEGERKGPDLKGMTLDVEVNAPDRFWISNSMAELENSVSIHVGGTVAEPELDGEVRLLRGKVTYYGRRFTLYSGRIFNVPPGLNPTLEAQAEVVIGDIRIYLLLEGPLRKPSLHLSSLPPRSQEDLFSLLTVGHTRSSLESQESEALAVGAALVFTGPIIEQVGEEARDVAGIEYIQVEPTIGEERGTAARVTVGTQLSDRLFMSASQSVGVTQDQQVRLEYQVLDFLSVIGQQLQRGIYSLEVVYQYDFY